MNFRRVLVAVSDCVTKNSPALAKAAAFEKSRSTMNAPIARSLVVSST